MPSQGEAASWVCYTSPKTGEVMSVICGIDPGQKGALAFLDTRSGKIAELIRMPVEGRHFNEQEFIAIIKSFKIDLCAVERAQSMPGQGVVSMFSYGVHFGIIRGVLMALEVPHILVPPQKWQSALHVGIPQNVKPKEKSKIAARRLFPKANFRPGRTTTDHDGLIDALLIAEFARRSFGMPSNEVG